MEGIEDVPVWWIEEPFRETMNDFKMLREWLDNNRRRNTLLADGVVHPDRHWRWDRMDIWMFILMISWDTVSRIGEL